MTSVCVVAASCFMARHNTLMDAYEYKSRRQQPPALRYEHTSLRVRELRYPIIP